MDVYVLKRTGYNENVGKFLKMSEKEGELRREVHIL